VIREHHPQASRTLLINSRFERWESAIKALQNAAESSVANDG